MVSVTSKLQDPARLPKMMKRHEYNSHAGFKQIPKVNGPDGLKKERKAEHSSACFTNNANLVKIVKGSNENEGSDDSEQCQSG